MDTILRWIGQFLGWLDSLTGNYLIAMFIFALIVEVIMIPFAIIQQKNSRKQALLRPKEMAIHNKYKGRNDKQTQQKVTEEIQAMYQEEHFNQLSGCLPLLIQLPVILILYQVILNPLRYVVGVSADAITQMTNFITATAENGGLGLELTSSKGTIALINIISEKGIDFFSGLANFADAGENAAVYFEEFKTAVAAGMPDFTIWGINLADTPTISKPSLLWLVPVLTFVVYFGSMKLNRLFSYQPAKSGDAATDKATGCSNWMMDIMMPLFSVYITFIMPAAIGVYWIFKSIIGTGKQFIMSKAMPMPQFTEEDYKAAEREYAGKQTNKKTEYKVDFEDRLNNSRSLFREDASDDVTPEMQAEIDKKMAKSEDAPADTGAISRASLKDDSDKNK